MPNSVHLKVLTAIALIVAAGTACLSMGKAPSQTPADFRLRDLNGAVHTLSQHKGQLVMLNFWATWCPPCRAEMPAMEKLWRGADKKQFVLLAVNAGDPRDKVIAFSRENGYTFPILLDEQSAVARKYNITAIPTTYLIDRQGRIIKKQLGAKEWTWQELEPLLK